MCASVLGPFSSLFILIFHTGIKDFDDHDAEMHMSFHRLGCFELVQNLE